MNEIKSLVPFFLFNEAKFVFQKWGEGDSYSAFLWPQTCFSACDWAKDVGNFKEMLYSVQPAYTERPGQALSCSVAEGYVAQLRFCDHTAKDTIHVGHLLCCFQKFQVHQNYSEPVLTKAINVFRRELTQYVKYFSPPSYFPPPHKYAPIES